MSKKLLSLGALVGIWVFSSAVGYSLTVTSVSSVSDLVDELIDTPIVSVSNVVFTGELEQVGWFSDGASSIGLDSGIIFSTGKAKDAEGPNSYTNTGTEFHTSGDPDLDALISKNSFDAVSLAFDFYVPSGIGSYSLSFDLVFGSDEYEEYYQQGYLDSMALFIDGNNIAYVPGTTDIIGVGGISPDKNSSYYKSNTTKIFDVEYDGFTTVLGISSGQLSSGLHTFKLVLADVADRMVDSGVFIKKNPSNVSVVPEPATGLLFLLGFAGVGVSRKKF